MDEVIERLRTVIANQPRCTSQALCWACGRSGHLRNECPRKTGEQNASTAPKIVAHITDIKGEHDGLFVEGTVDDVPCQMV
ncbi:hypothetical protein JGG58_23315, partial [Salmonella enterica subsp. enterica serovar London]|nr:hypothetical protein [Salmonella enterica subsp. enterica serovar London]